MSSKKIRMTDDAGHFWLDGKLYKASRPLRTSREEAMKGVYRMEYVEVDPAAYDTEIDRLVKRIVSFPQVDLTDILRDALYDLPLATLRRVEKKLDQEEVVAEKTAAEPRVKTQRGERGTCVELRIGNRFGMELRV